MSIFSSGNRLIGGISSVIPGNGTGCLTGQPFTFSTGSTYAIDLVTGPTISWNTGTSINDRAGFWSSLTNNFTIRRRNPRLTCSFTITDIDAANNRIFIGFATPTGSAMLTTVDFADPLVSASGIGLALDAGNFKIAVNDGVDSTVFFDFLFPDPVVAVANTPYTVILVANEDNDGWTATISQYEAPSNILGLQDNLGSDVPDSTTELKAGAVIQTKVGSSKTLKIHSWEGEF